MTSNRHSFVDYTGVPYVKQFGVRCPAYQNYKYTAQPENRSRTIVRSNQPTSNSQYVEGFSLSKKNQKSCDCDDE